MLLEQEVNRGFQEERVVNGDRRDARDAVPTELAATRYRRVHDIV